MNRRKLLATSGGTLALILAGCASDTGDGNDDPGQGTTGNNSPETANSSSVTSATVQTDNSVQVLDHEWYNNGQYKAGVSGRIKNVASEELSFVEVVTYFFDGSGTQVGLGSDDVTSLADGQVWEFDTKCLDDKPDSVVDYKIETNVRTTTE